MRAFVALDLPEPVVDAIGALQEWLPLGRHVAPDNLHLTLAFLGEQPDGVIAEADAALQGLRLPAFELSLCGVDVFGGPAPGLVFLGVAPNPALGALHRKVMGALRGAGLGLGRVRFRPHVTLARLPKRLGAGDRDRLGQFLAAHADLRLPPFRVGHFTLYRSTLGRGAPLHEVLADYPLGAGT